MDNMVICPKCNHYQKAAETCESCGVYIEKFREQQKASAATREERVMPSLKEKTSLLEGKGRMIFWLCVIALFPVLFKMAQNHAKSVQEKMDEMENQPFQQVDCRRFPKDKQSQADCQMLNDRQAVLDYEAANKVDKGDCGGHDSTYLTSAQCRRFSEVKAANAQRMQAFDSRNKINLEKYNIDRKVTTLKRELNRAERELSIWQSQLSKLEEKAADSEISTYDESQAYQDDRIDEVADKVSKLESKVQSLNSDLFSLNSELDDLNYKLEQIKTQ